MVDPRTPAIPSDEKTPTPGAGAATHADETGAASFPASDPPAVWTWELDRRTAEGTGGRREPDKR